MFNHPLNCVSSDIDIFIVSKINVAIDEDKSDDIVSYDALMKVIYDVRESDGQ